MSRVGHAVAGTLTHHIHRPGDHPDILRGDRLDDVIEDADPRPDRHSFPRPASVEDLVPVQLHSGAQAVGLRCRCRDPVEFIGQRDRLRSVDE